MKEIFYKLETSSTTGKPVAIQYWLAPKRAFECGITWQIFRHEKLHTILQNKLCFLHRHQKRNSQCLKITQKVAFDNIAKLLKICGSLIFCCNETFLVIFKQGKMFQSLLLTFNLSSSDSSCGSLSNSKLSPRNLSGWTEVAIMLPSFFLSSFPRNSIWTTRVSGLSKTLGADFKQQVIMYEVNFFLRLFLKARPARPFKWTGVRCENKVVKYTSARSKGFRNIDQYKRRSSSGFSFTSHVVPWWSSLMKLVPTAQSDYAFPWDLGPTQNRVSY